MHFPSSPRREATPGVPRGARRRLPWLAPFVGALAALALLLAPSLASADSGSSLTVIGTSDVSDSGLIPNLIQPAFHQAYPQYTFKYIGTASGTAITEAENGSAGASVLIVHAASLENTFVSGGYSYEPFGRALWTNDFVLAGNASDPAGVHANAANNIVQAFADIATAGYNGGSTTPLATFVSRGGTPGTTTAEHKIWAQVDSTGLAASVPGLLLCTVPSSPTDNLGGGETPIAPGGGVTADGQLCPNGVLPGAAGGGTLPDWYVTTGVTQGPNVVLANACTTGTGGPAGGGIKSAANGCYVFTDRGTYDYLASGNTNGGTDAVGNLTILTRNNSASAPGGIFELENYFHGYIINPATSPSPVNLPAAQAFINFITSPTIQSQLSSYLYQTGDPGGPPFVADASPAITASGFPTTPLPSGTAITVTGTVTNQEPGYAVPANQPVSVDEVVGGVPVAVAGGTTTNTGAYSITFTPASSGVYQVATGLISLAEPQLALTPAYGDELSPGASAPSLIAVQAGAVIGKTTTSAGTVSVAGLILPAAPDTTATATLLARPQSSTGGFRVIGTQTLPKGQATFAVNGSLKGGKWTVEVQYADPGSLTAATTATKNVTVPANAVKVSFGKLKSKHGKLTLAGRLSQGPTTSGATVKLFALSVGKLKIAKHPTTHKKHKKHKPGTKQRSQARAVAASAKGAKFKQVAKVKIKTGKKTYTLKHTFAPGHRYVLQLEYVHKGQTSTYSKYRYLNVR